MRITDLIHDALIKLALVAASEPYRLTVDKMNQTISVKVGDLPPVFGVYAPEDENAVLTVINQCIKLSTPKVARDIETCRMVSNYDYELISIIRALNDVAPLELSMEVEVRRNGSVHIDWDNKAAVRAAPTERTPNTMRTVCTTFRILLNSRNS